MLQLICHIVLLCSLVIVFYQDWKHRAVQWIIFPIISLVAILLFSETKLSWLIVIMNMVFLVTVLVCLFLYMTIKEKRVVNILKAGFGLGDVLFLLAVAPLFAGGNYILFFISGMIISGLVHLLITKGNLKAQIPLAGYLAVYLFLLKSIDLVFNVNIFYTSISK